MRKKQGNSKQSWLDWLADDPPAPDAKQELRERFKQQANSYRPINRTQSAPESHSQPNVPAPQINPEARAVSRTTLNAATPPAAPRHAESKSSTPTVSIQIHLPSFHSERFVVLKQRGTYAVQVARDWLHSQWRTNPRRTVGIAIVSLAVLLGLFIPPLLLKDNAKSAFGSNSAAASGANTTEYEKPPFQVVTPTTKTKLATPDGAHSAYDGKKNVYTFSDSMGGNGFIVSQQPIPPQFSDGDSAVEGIAPGLQKGGSPTKLKVITGTAYLAVDPKYDSQTVVASVRDVLLFIQSSHAFKASEWENYLNTLQ